VKFQCPHRSLIYCVLSLAGQYSDFERGSPESLLDFLMSRVVEAFAHPSLLCGRRDGLALPPPITQGYFLSPSSLQPIMIYFDWRQYLVYSRTLKPTARRCHQHRPNGQPSLQKAPNIASPKPSLVLKTSAESHAHLETALTARNPLRNRP